MQSKKSFFDSTINTLFVLLLPAFFLYSKSLFFDFTPMDEQWLIIKSTSFLEDWKNIFKAFETSISETYYRPLFSLSLIINYQLGKLAPFIYHLTNVFLHLWCIVLVFKFLELFGTQRKVAFLLTLLFSVHPLFVHAVAWIPGRNDILLCIFALLSFNSLIKHSQSAKEFNNHLYFHLFYFVAALFTKENAIVLPLIYAAMSITLKGFNKMFWILCALWFLFTLVWLCLFMNIVPLKVHLDHSLAKTFINFLLAYLLYIGKIVLPINLSVFPTIEHSNFIWGIISLIGAAAIAFSLGFSNKKNVVVGLIIFFITLAIPVWFSVSKSSGEHYEHRMYLPMIGVLLMVANLNFSSAQKIIKNVAFLLLIIFTLVTFKRLNIYKNTANYVAAGLKEAPDYYFFYMVSGDELYRKQQFEASLQSFNKAIELRPDKGDLYNYRAGVNFALSRYNEAMADFNLAVEKSNGNKSFILNRCMANAKLNRTDKALEDFYFLKQCCQNLIPPKFEMELMNRINK